MDIKGMGYDLKRVEDKTVVLSGELLKGLEEQVRITVNSLIDSRAEEALAQRLLSNQLVKYNVLSEYLKLGYYILMFRVVEEEVKITMQDVDEETDFEINYSLDVVLNEYFIEYLIEATKEKNYLKNTLDIDDEEIFRL